MVVVVVVVVVVETKSVGNRNLQGHMKLMPISTSGNKPLCKPRSGEFKFTVSPSLLPPPPSAIDIATTPIPLVAPTGYLVGLTLHKKSKAADQVALINSGEWPTHHILQRVRFTPNTVTIFDVIVISKVLHLESELYTIERQCYWWAKFLFRVLQGLDALARTSTDTELELLNGRKRVLTWRKRLMGTLHGLTIAMGQARAEERFPFIQTSFEEAKKKFSDSVCHFHLAKCLMNPPLTIHQIHGHHRAQVCIILFHSSRRCQV